ncbi:uncharacterized protein N7469_001956 [Penicillium citrinum]|uniref:Uncharacterized protein n=1 Tax=Penicillium citrinum TaxID=5077 RepID=A0A9W9P9K9_PENCI|nr:uncharacterized protein N7469_001956 [Penicillium citrinum]KAJ5240365.1 hypothetical protein N7469_001956 [Penicillium citrinum]
MPTSCEAVGSLELREPGQKFPTRNSTISKPYLEPEHQQKRRKTIYSGSDEYGSSEGGINGASLQNRKEQNTGEQLQEEAHSSIATCELAYGASIGR